MFKKLRTVIYQVTDLQQSKEWYSSLLGITPYFDEDFYVGFDINGCELGLHPYDETVTKGSQAIAYWAVDHISDCLDRLVEKGAVILQGISDVGGGIQVATLVDPWGNAVGLIEGA